MKLCDISSISQKNMSRNCSSKKKRDQKPELVNYSYSATSFIVESKSPTKAGGACLIFLECFLMRDEMGFFFHIFQKPQLFLVAY